ncbi:hypothetical protein [Mesorhizobium sp. B2-4-17]|uniref:hypothetical protein n=1 Tax=Mesorhizobium sp. B2-4-17 TaxID=2589932 RepID=UPI001127B5B5|nr:hypothetical protein [Mesorhizobium sp. B2-4-17]TPK73646.1 hypothetical protein FJ548_27855 [Mesorhizobium sp. B2-4-17]
MNDVPYPIQRKYRARSRTTNGKELLPGLDGRSKWARRLHDLCSNHIADLGGPRHVTQSQFVLIRNAANLTIILEKWELQFATEPTINVGDLLGYQTVSNSLRRVLETLGLNRVTPPPDTTPHLDLTKLTDSEQQRFRILSHQAGEIGLQSMSEAQALELQTLMTRASGRAVGPSITDASYRERPTHELNLSVNPK